MATPIDPISTMRRTAAGRAAAMDSAMAPPMELPMMSTAGTPRVSSRASACSVQAARPKRRGSPVAVPPKPSWSGAMTRRAALSAGITGRQLASAVTPGPEPCSSSTGGPSASAGAPVSMTAVGTPATSSRRR